MIPCIFHGPLQCDIQNHVRDAAGPVHGQILSCFEDTLVNLLFECSLSAIHPTVDRNYTVLWRPYFVCPL